MSFKLLSLCALLALCAIGTIANPIALDSRDDTVVNTPGGPRPKSQVHHVPDGASLHHTGDAVHIVSATGDILHTNILDKSQPAQGLASRTFMKPSRVVEPRAISTGYVAYTYFTNNSNANPISNFSSTWTVPPNPKTNHNQLLYLFSALTPASDDAILQPVLQYGTSGAGGGNYWATASWYLVGANTYHTTLVPVTVGSALNGVITLQKSALATDGTTTYTYNAQFTHSPYTTITITTTEQLNWAWEALEIYAAQAITDLPTGTTPFKNINMVNMNGINTPLNWLTRNDTTDGFMAMVKVDGVPSGEIDIVY
ncbi:hypothetical protein BDN70DRAFT_962850 [Pholiota conissans]|uniref:Uncharacterized protein n=1 Tax=Pholiota conissans TaxID=109636 RepID=A0A9P5YR82_9AGAR|nr:hypothetical protein BDN70DRAFT_962850 [Pholiota conissans]